MRRARVDLRLPEAQKAFWQAEADDRGIDLSELIRQAVEAYIKLGSGTLRKTA